jgi:hypothetical protein
MYAIGTVDAYGHAIPCTRIGCLETWRFGKRQIELSGTPERGFRVRTWHQVWPDMPASLEFDETTPWRREALAWVRAELKLAVRLANRGE